MVEIPDINWESFDFSQLGSLNHDFGVVPPTNPFPPGLNAPTLPSNLVGLSNNLFLPFDGVPLSTDLDPSAAHADIANLLATLGSTDYSVETPQQFSNFRGPDDPFATQ